MKHFADNNNKKSAPKHSAKHAAGRHYTDEPAADRFAGAVDGAFKKLSSLKGRQKETPKTEAREEAEVLYDDTPVEFPMDYPEDYPEVNTEITVTGTFNVYSEGNSKYLQLKDAEVVF